MYEEITSSANQGLSTQLFDSNGNANIGNTLQMKWDLWSQETKKKKLYLTHAFNVHIVNPTTTENTNSASVVNVLSERYRIRDIVLRKAYGNVVISAAVSLA